MGGPCPLPQWCLFCLPWAEGLAGSRADRDPQRATQMFLELQVHDSAFPATSGQRVFLDAHDAQGTPQIASVPTANETYRTPGFPARQSST